MTSFFLLHATVEDPVRQDDFEASWTELSKLFPKSAYVQCEWARYLDNIQAADLSVEKFEQLLKDHPYRLDYMQDYSDALFVTKKYDQLSHLARYCAQVDPFRPETCFVIGKLQIIFGIFSGFFFSVLLFDTITTDSSFFFYLRKLLYGQRRPRIVLGVLQTSCSVQQRVFKSLDLDGS